MSLTWRQIGIACVAATLIVPLSVTYLVWEDINEPEISQNALDTIADKDSQTKQVTLTKKFLTFEELDKASEVRLQRMAKPAPLPPVTTVEQVSVPETSITFAGKFVGTIVDPNPEFSFAILLATSGEVRLVQNGHSTDKTNNDWQLSKVENSRVHLKHLPSNRVIEFEVDK